MLICCIAIFFATLQVQNARIDNNETSIQTTAGLRQITNDRTPKRLAVASPDGKLVAYVVDLWLTSGPHKNDSGSPEDVIVVDTKGNILRHIIPEGYIPAQFDQLEWIDNQRVGAMTCGHANCLYWMLDADTGKTLKKMEGGFDFVWSHNRKWVARRFVDTGMGPSNQHDTLVLDDETVYPSSRELATMPRPGHVLGDSFVWSPKDNWVAFIDVQQPDGDSYIVVASPGGAVLRDRIAGDLPFDTQIKWTDDAHLKATASGRTFNLVIAGNQLRDVTPRR